MPHLTGGSGRGRENSNNAGQLDCFYTVGHLYYQKYRNKKRRIQKDMRKRERDRDIREKEREERQRVEGGIKSTIGREERSK